MVTESGLRGRGGAGYSTGRKWSTMPLGPDAPHPKYIVCNGDEMEPGSFKDRFLMERNPHLLLEGMLLAGFATEADDGLHLPARRSTTARSPRSSSAIGEARERGYLGEDVLGSGLLLRHRPAREHRPLHLRRGVGDAERAREPARPTRAPGRRT